MANGSSPGSVQVLRLDAVRWAIDTLTSCRVHPYFIAYLHIRAKGAEAGTTSGIYPRWAELGSYLAVPGGPPGKPYYRPFLGHVRDRSRYWMNENLAGSWAPSSLREGQAPLEVVVRQGQSFSLKRDHAQLALRHLLFDNRLPVMALAAYLYRNYGFVQESREIEPFDVIATFAWDFGFSELQIDPAAGLIADPQPLAQPGRPRREEFSVLFDATIPEQPDAWFEEFPVDSEAASS